MSLIPVEDKPGIFRDSTTNAIINRNTNDYDTYVKQRNRMRSKEDRINDLEKKVDDLSGDIGDIKSMLQTLISK
tara:strand:+ start:1205 stop:1426 length:222 start_codon:yes stop_codon:yes gene_type:complete